MDKGILFYGFQSEIAKHLLGIAAELEGKDVTGISASGMEDLRVIDALDKGDFTNFVDMSDKFMMFLGYELDDIRAYLKAFPQDAERPIFCSLTESNIGWKISYLIDHLKGEREKFRKGEKE